MAAKAMACAVIALGLAAAEAQSASRIDGNAVQQGQKELAAADRQNRMAADADRLVTMAQRLKLSVDKTNKNVLSIDVIREAERIEKLARELRENVRPTGTQAPR